MRLPLSTTLGFLALSVITGCPDDEPAPASGGGSESGSTGGSGPGSSETIVDPDTSGGGSSSGGPSAELIPARGLHIDWVEANQGVGVPIGQDGAWVGPSERLARLLQKRNTLIRGFWKIDADFEPREIDAHLLLAWADGTEERLVQTRFIEEDAFIGDLDRVFYWGIEAERTLPGLTYAIELYEHDPAYADGAPAEPPYFPEVEGEPVQIGIEESYQLIKTVVVPFNYDDGANCVTQPDTSEATMQLFQDLMFMMNPVDRLEFTLHESVDWDTPLENFGQLNTYLSDLRFDEGAPPETYYYGLVDVCSGGLGGAGGQAFGIPEGPTMDLAYQRVSSGLSLDPDWSAETFVHEVGHSQGRRHVACEGEGGPDITYPNEGGVVGEWGFGVIDFGLRHPTVHKDYMTYCHPVWVGTWGWNKVQPFVETLSTWDEAYPGNGAVAPDDPYSGSVLVGTIAEDGPASWITVPGGLPGGSSGDATLELDYGDGHIAVQAARVQSLADSNDVMITAPLPDDFDRVVALTSVHGAVRTRIDRRSIRERHTARTVKRRGVAR